MKKARFASVRMAALFLFAGAAMYAVAQDDLPAATLRVATQLSAAAPLDEAYWAASLDRAIARSPRVIDVRKADAEGSGQKKIGNLITVEVTAGAVGAIAKTEWRIIDPVDGSTFASGSEEGAIPSRRELDEIHWIALVEALEKWDTLTIYAPPGTRIEGIGNEDIVIGDSGEARVLLKIPETYNWKASLSGMATERGILTLPNQNEPLKIAMRPMYLWAIEAGVRWAFFPELRVTRSFANDRLFLRAGFSQSLWAFSIGENEDELLVSGYGGRFDPNIGYGFYIISTEHRIRPYLSMDLSLRLVHTKDALLYFDLPHPFRLTPSFGLDFGNASRFSGFIEAGADMVAPFDEKRDPFNGRFGTRFRF